MTWPRAPAETAMPLDDDQTAYSGEPLPPRRVPRRDDRRDMVPPPLWRQRDHDDLDDDEPLPRRPRRRDRREETSGVVTALGRVGIVFGLLHVIGAIVLCLTGTVAAGMFVGLGQMIADEQGRAGGGQQQAGQVVDVCNGVGLFTLLFTAAPGL